MTHSIMFHHFHNNIHLPAQGSISSEEFYDMIAWLGKRFNILDANNYTDKFISGTLNKTDICLSFDDALLCQYDIVIPVLEELNITAFFFVYSSALLGKSSNLEVYRLFRSSVYKNIDVFYKSFFEKLISVDNIRYVKHKEKFNLLNYLNQYSFYSKNDKWFRYLRDVFLSTDKYDEIMQEIMREKNFDTKAAKENIWMTEEQLLDIHLKGHKVGLHSYSHPTVISKLTIYEQTLEYKKNLQHLSKLLNCSNINSMAHPCGDYSNETLDILKNMGIKIGFCSNMIIKDRKGSLEVPREDHANILKEMYK